MGSRDPLHVHYGPPHPSPLNLSSCTLAPPCPASVTPREGASAVVIPPHQRRIGPYELRRLQGKGGFGQIYLVWKKNAAGVPNPFVLKFPHSNIVSDEAIVRRFLREARHGLRLKTHPNIVLVIDVGRYGKMPYIVMEYVDGIDLSHLLKEVRKRRRPELTPWLAIRLSAIQLKYG